MSVMETVKAHPFIVGGIAIFTIVIIVIIASSGGEAPQVQNAIPQGSTETGTALQLAQMESTTQANQISASLEGLRITQNTALQAKVLEAQTTENANYLAYKAHSEDTAAALAANNYAAGVATLQSSLAAQVATKQSEDAKVVALAGYGAQISLADISAKQNIMTAGFLRDAVVSANDTTARIAISSNETSARIAQSQFDYGYKTTVANANRDIELGRIQGQTAIQQSQIQSQTAIQQSQIASDTSIWTNITNANRDIAVAQEATKAAANASYASVMNTRTVAEHTGGLFGGGGFLGLGI